MYGDDNPAPAPDYAHEAVTQLSLAVVGGPGGGVELPTARYNELQEERDLPRALMGGSRRMRGMAEKYMPKHEAEDPQTYRARLASTICYGGYKDTVLKMAAKFFSEPVILKEDVPEQLTALCDDIDGQGRALTPFLMDVMNNAMVDGVTFILADMPAVNRAVATVADLKLNGTRPYWVNIAAGNLIGWRTVNVGGKQIITQLRIKETVMVPSGEYGEKQSMRVRVLFPFGFLLYEYQNHVSAERPAGYYLIDKGSTTFAAVPLVAVYTNRVGMLEGEPPLASLAEMNQEHWVSSSEQRRALTFSRFAMLALIGVSKTDGPIAIGPDRTLNLPAGGDAHYVEPTGAGIASGQNDLDAIEKRMLSAGMTLRIDDAGATTATASAIDSDDSNASLRAISKALADAVAQALQFTADMLKIPKGGTVKVFDDFANSQAPGTISEIIQLNVAGIISVQTAQVELQRRQMLSEDFDPEAEKVLLSDEMDQQMEAMQRAAQANAQPGAVDPTTGAEKPESKVAS